MALRPDRFEDATDISFFMNVTAERGLIVVHDSSGSGAALDDSNAYVAVPTGQAPSTTKPAGLLLNDVVNVDQTRQHLNWHKDETQLGGKVCVLRRGWIVTDQINGTPAGNGAPAYYTNAGLLTETDPGSGPKVGRFLSKKDVDGFAKVEINITG
jgi:hypothetical protein